AVQFELNRPVSSSTEIEVIPNESPDSFCYLDCSLLIQTNDPGVKMMKLYFYQHMAQAAIAREKAIQGLRREINRTRIVMVQLRKETRILIAQEVKRVEQNAAAHEALIDQRFSQSERIHGASVDLLRSRIQDDERVIQDTREELRNTEERCLEQERS